MATTAAPAPADPPQQPQNAPPPPAVAPDQNITQQPPPLSPAAIAALVVQLEDDDRAVGALVVDQHVAVPQAAFRKLKDTARDKGRREHEAALNARAAALGFATVDAMFAAIEKGSVMATTVPPAPTTPPAPAAAPAAAPPPAPAAGAPAGAPAAAAGQQPPAPEGDPNEPENDRRVPDVVRKKLRQAREEMRQKTAQADAARQQAEQQANAYQQQIAVMRTEQTMREDLIRSGVQDLEYVWFECKKHLESIKADEEKLKAFDVKTWSQEQKKLRPYLFGEQPVPATTGVTTPPPAQPPTPGAVTGAAGDAAKVDARNLPPADFQKRMKELGINVQGSAPPLRSQ